MFSQQLINEYVTVEIVIEIVAVSILALYALYKFIDHLLFCRRLNKRK